MLRLLIEIPNADGRGRRIVTSTAGPAADSDSLLQGRIGPEGRDYIAVHWPSTQRLENQTVRDDDERLMLVGVDTSRLTAEERERVRDALRQLRPDVAGALATIDWSGQTHGTVIEAAGLSDLLRRPPFTDLPKLKDVAPPIPPAGASGQTLNRQPWPLPAIAACAAGLVAAATWWNLPNPAPPGPPAPQTPPAPAADERIKEISRAMGCSEAELKGWIAAAQGVSREDTSRAIDDHTLRSLMGAQGVERFFVFDKITAEESQLREFVESLSPTKATDGATIRACLHKAHAELVALHSAAEEADRCEGWKQKLETDATDRPAMAPDEVAFIAAIVGFAKESVAANTAEPVGPFFDPNDHRRFADLARFFTPERRAHIENVTPIRYPSDNSSEALRQAAESMPSDHRKVTQTVDGAYVRTEWRAFKDLVDHFNGLCRALAHLKKP